MANDYIGIGILYVIIMAVKGYKLILRKSEIVIDE